MRSVCRKVAHILRCLQHATHDQALAAERRRVFLLDHSDLNDLQQYIISGSCCYYLNSRSPKPCCASAAEFRQLCRPLGRNPHKIAALWPSQLSMSSKDCAWGAVLGAFVGDAAGGVLKFLQTRPSSEQVDAALQMCGGGVWQLGQGQITDDSELAMCLLHALAGAAASGPLPLDDIARWFIKWLHSPPFDIGTTTRNALTVGHEAEAATDVGARMVATAAQHNQRSQSNGCLMRVTPLAVWAHQQTPHVVAQHAMAQTALTHPNKTAQVGTAAYCIAISHLINHPRDAVGALAAVQDWLQQQQEQPGCSSAASTVLKWLQEAQEEGPGPQVATNMGHMRWGLVHAFRALHMQLSYTEAVRHVLLLGGDTDTNAAIVGGMVGALWGASTIPNSMTGPVLSFGAGSGGQARPTFLHSNNLLQLFEQVWSYAKM